MAINPARGIERTRQDIARLELPLLAGEPDDIASLFDESSPTTVLEANDVGQPLVVRAARGGVAESTRPASPYGC